MLSKELLKNIYVNPYPVQHLQVKAEQSIEVYVNNSLKATVEANTFSYYIPIRLYDVIRIHSQGDALLISNVNILISLGMLEMLSETSGQDISFRFIKESYTGIFSPTFVVV